MSAQALQITARGPRADAEAAAAAIDADPALEGASYSIIEEDETRELWRIDLFPTSDEEAEGLLSLLTDRRALRVAAAPLADADWLAMALSGLPPVRAGRFFVFGAHDAGRIPANAVALRIEAAAAFGTGHHGTTLGCLVAYHDLLRARRFPKVLDVGTGTGVLAIAAARTGGRVVLGTDIDPASVRIAAENAALNQARARFARADGLAARTIAAAAAYDLVFANILARPLVRLAPDIVRALRPGG
ncbi:MAG TPA: 50S ribosomal protein L11 methyltransferase, partial [Caulobacteraceae bacterium]|nr:50S ribosomal protein L11 methyltransferase [Caulobacteraceae bacterium]